MLDKPVRNLLTRAIAADRDHGSARACLCSTTGRWLVFRASCLRAPDGQLGDTALTIEPAKAAEIAPIIVQAYELTTREQQITQLIAQGHGTPHIARRLHLSPPHGARLRQDDLREGRSVEPGRARRQALRRALRADPHRAGSQGAIGLRCGAYRAASN
jgi:hypothetical protein